MWLLPGQWTDMTEVGSEIAGRFVLVSVDNGKPAMMDYRMIQLRKHGETS